MSMLLVFMIVLMMIVVIVCGFLSWIVCFRCVSVCFVFCFGVLVWNGEWYRYGLKKCIVLELIVLFV